MHRCTAVVATLVAAAGLAACSSDSGGEPAAASTSASASASASTGDMCASADALRGSLSALSDVDVVASGTNGLQEAWTAVEDDWAALKQTAGDEYADQIDGVQAAADDVQSAVDAARADATAATLGDAATSVRVFLQQADQLVEEVRSAC